MKLALNSINKHFGKLDLSQNLETGRGRNPEKLDKWTYPVTKY